MLKLAIAAAVRFVLSQTAGLACCTNIDYPSSCWPVSDPADLTDCDPDDLLAWCVLDDTGFASSCTEASMLCCDDAGACYDHLPGNACKGSLVLP